MIHTYWPQCPAEISAHGQHLVISSSRHLPALHPLQMPVKSSYPFSGKDGSSNLENLRLAIYYETGSEPPRGSQARPADLS